MTQSSDQAAATQPGAVRAAAGKLRTFYDRYTPWISLGLGVLARAFSRRGVDFAPKAVAIVALAWLLPLAVARWLHAPAESRGEPAGSAGSEPSREGMGTLPGFPYRRPRESKLHRFVRSASPAVTVLLYRNVLFFLVPIWFGSAHLPSLNMGVP